MPELSERKRAEVFFCMLILFVASVGTAYWHSMYTPDFTPGAAAFICSITGGSLGVWGTTWKRV